MTFVLQMGTLKHSGIAYTDVIIIISVNEISEH